MHMWMRPFLHQRMKTQKAKDECGLVAELLQHLPEDVLTKLLALMNDLLFSRELPSTWREGQSSNITQPFQVRCCMVKSNNPWGWIDRNGLTTS